MPDGNSRLRRKKSSKDRLKKIVSETGSGSYRQRANSKEHERSPKTEKDNFDTEHDTAGQNPCLAGLHREALFLHHFYKELAKKKTASLSGAYIERQPGI